jgi:hypothetical protein
VDILEFVKERASRYNCPECRQSLQDAEIELVEEESPKYTFEMECDRCEVHFLVVIEVDDEVMDLMGKSSRPRRLAPPVTGEEVLEVRELLAAHFGSLTDLLKEPAENQ